MFLSQHQKNKFFTNKIGLLLRSVCPMGGVFAPGFFFFSKDLLLFLTQKMFFFRKKKNSKKNFFESKTTVNPLRKKNPMGQTDLRAFFKPEHFQGILAHHRRKSFLEIFVFTLNPITPMSIPSPQILLPSPAP